MTGRRPLAALEARFGPWVRMRPTRTGAGYLVLLAGVLFAAVNTGNNLLYVVLAGQLGVLVLSNVLAEVNLRGLRLARILPAEVFAGEPAVGAYEVTNLRRLGPAVTVHVEELDEGGAHGLFAVVGPGRVAEAPARWRLQRRGRRSLDRVRIWSDFPFGLVRRSLDLSLPVDILVYPPPLEGRGSRPELSVGATREDPRRHGREGDFQSLRPYRPGDPLRDLHWRTTARMGRPMVVERAAAGAPEVVVRVDEQQGERWERALGLAAGEIELHVRRGDAVGLAMGDQVFQPRTGEAWRRHLLTRLALAPERPVGGEPADE